MKKIFISQPMKDKTPEEISAEREAMIAAAREKLGDDVEVLESYFPDFDGSPLAFLGKGLIVLAEADAAVFASGWIAARGCRVEHMCCRAYGIPIVGL